MKVHEFIGYRKYAVCIAAETTEAAKKAAEKLGNTWLHVADEIGCEELDIEDIADVRDIPDDYDVYDCARIKAEE